MNHLIDVAKHFSQQREIIDLCEFGSGNINRTFLVTLESREDRHFILQQINTQVFRRPDLVMHNMSISTEHIRDRLQQFPLSKGRRWEIPHVIPAQDGEDHWTGPDGSFWRAISFIENTRSFDVIRDKGHAEEIGRALGIFHDLLSDLPPERLADTLEGFHITPRYLAHYDDVLARYRGAGSPEIDNCCEFVNSRRALAHVLEDARENGRLRVRTIHGDPKVNNFMIDITTGQAVSIVDLDTIKPGLVHYDIGDCLRSGCNPLGEETGQFDNVHFDLGLCRAVLKGYLSMARDFLTADDLDHLYDSIRLLAFELGLRFLTDHLEGDVYFRVARPGHNLSRALVQFRLTESIESQEEAIRRSIRDTG